MDMMVSDSSKGPSGLWFIKCRVYKIPEETQASSIGMCSFRDGQLPFYDLFLPSKYYRVF